MKNLARHSIAILLIVAFIVGPYLFYQVLDYFSVSFLNPEDLNEGRSLVTREWLCGAMQAVIYGVLSFFGYGIYTYVLLPFADEKINGKDEDQGHPGY